MGFPVLHPVPAPGENGVTGHASLPPGPEGLWEDGACADSLSTGTGRTGARAGTRGLGEGAGRTQLVPGGRGPETGPDTGLGVLPCLRSKALLNLEVRMGENGRIWKRYRLA